jgi:predicted nucleic acid-binding protein
VIVADSTLVAGLLFPTDEFHPVAKAIREMDADWRCPELVFSELRSVALKRVKSRVPLDAVIAQCNLAASAVSVYRMHNHTVLHTAMEGGIWAYDAEYVALARQLQAALVTSDAEVVKKFPAVAMLPDQFLSGGR